MVVFASWVFLGDFHSPTMALRRYGINSFDTFSTVVISIWYPAHVIVMVSQFTVQSKALRTVLLMTMALAYVAYTLTTNVAQLSFLQAKTELTLPLMTVVMIQLVLLLPTDVVLLKVVRDALTA